MGEPGTPVIEGVSVRTTIPSAFRGRCRPHGSRSQPHPTVAHGLPARRPGVARVLQWYSGVRVPPTRTVRCRRTIASPLSGRSGRSKDRRAVALSKAAVVSRTTAGRSPSPGGRFEGPSGRSSLSRVTVVPRTGSTVALLRGRPAGPDGTSRQRARIAHLRRAGSQTWRSLGTEDPLQGPPLSRCYRHGRPSPLDAHATPLSQNRPGTLSPGPRRRWPSWRRRLPVAHRAALARGMA